MRHFILLLFSALLFFSAALAQGPKVKVLEAVPRNAGYKILCIQQDSSDFLWLGTNKGLFKYNGESAESIALPDGIADKKITSIFIKNTTLLAGCANGQAVAINLLAPQKNQRQFSIANAAISSCLIDSKGQFWFATETEGITVVSNNEMNQLASRLPDQAIHCLFEKNNTVFAGCDIGLIGISIDGNDSYKSDLYSKNQGISDQLVTHISSTQNNTLWVGGQSGTIDLFDIQKEKFSPLPLSNTPVVGEWIGLYPLGNKLMALTSSNQIFTIPWPNVQNIQHAQIDLPTSENSIGTWIDKNGQLFLCTANQNLYLANLELIYITEHDQTSFTNARALASDDDGNIWFSNETGIYRHPLMLSAHYVAERIYDKPTQMADIISLCQGQKNEMWFGTFGNGLGRINTTSKKIDFFTEKNGLINNSVLAMVNDGESLWLATLGGVSRYRFSTSSFENFSAETGPGSNYVYTLFRDKKNNIWLGTDGKGPVRFDGKTFSFLKKQFPEMDKSIVAIDEDRLNQLWFCSTNGQLGCLSDQTFSVVTLVDNEQNPELLAMQYDGENHLIILTSAGLGKVNINTKSFQFITNNEGFNSNFLNVITRDKLKHVWIGTEQCMLRYNSIAKAPLQRPTTQIQNVLVMLQAIDTLRHEFPHNQNHFTFQTAGIWYNDPGAVQFEYKLLGFNLDWVKTRDETIVFSQLPPGSYTFLLRAYLGNNPLNSEVKKYDFVILPPLWQRPLFITLLLVAAAGLSFILVRYRLKTIQKREAVKQELFRSQLQTLRNQVNPHFLFNSFHTLISSIAKSKEDGIDYVEKLSDYFRIVLEQREKDTISVKEELDFVNTYFFLQKKRFGDNLLIHVEVNERTLLSHIPPMTLQLLAENAIKHNVISKAKPLHITITSSNDHLVVSNNLQEKTNKEKSTGVGLNNIINRYDILFSKKIEIVSTDELFAVRLPIISFI